MFSQNFVMFHFYLLHYNRNSTTNNYSDFVLKRNKYTKHHERCRILYFSLLIKHNTHIKMKYQMWLMLNSVL